MKTLLVIACREGNEWLRDFLVDPVLADELAQAGWSVIERAMEEVDGRHLAAADAVVFIQQPYITNVQGTAAFPRVQHLLDEHLRQGGGLVLIFDDRYFQVFPNVNRFLEPYGARVIQEILNDHDPAHKTTFFHDPLVTALATRNIDRSHPISQGIASISFPVEPAGGLTFPLELSKDWEVVVRGEKSAFSRAVWTDQTSRFPEAPPLVAARTVGGGGRLVVLASHSSLSLLNGFHRRWDSGIILKSGMKDLLQNAFRWAAGSPLQRQGAVPPSQPRAPHTPFAPVPPARQNPPSCWQKGSSVVVPERPEDLAVWKGAASGRLDWMAMAIPSQGLTHEEYESWVRQCREASDTSFAFLPALQIHDEYGNPALVIAPKKWPITRKLRTLNHIGHNIQGHYVLLSPEQNPWPAWSIGGFQGFALASYRDGQRTEFPIETYRLLQAGDWFVSPHAVDYADSPDALRKNLAMRRGLTYVGADTPEGVEARLPQLFQNTREIFFSEGPVLGEFALKGERLIDDIWEGTYYLWKEADDVGVLTIAVNDAASGVREARIYRDGFLWRRYLPQERAWRHSIALASDQGSHCFWVEVENERGEQAVSTTVRTRAPHYWAHGGGDRMNTYSGVSLPSPQSKDIWVHGEWRAVSGDVRFGLGWGSWIRIMPAIPNPELLPVGREWDSPAGGIQNIFTAPQLSLGGVNEFTESKPRRVGYALSHEQAVILKETVDRVPVLRNGLVAIEPSQILQAEITYSIPRWFPGGAVSIMIEASVSLRHDATLAAPALLRLLEIQAQSSQWFRTVTRSDGKTARDVSIAELSAQPSLPAQWAVMWPDPLGAVGVFGLDERPYYVHADAGAKAPRLRFFAEIPAGRLKQGEKIRLRYALVVGACAADHPGRVFQKIWNHWTRPAIQLTRGRLLPGAGVLAIELEDGLAAGEIDLPDGEVPVLVRFTGTSRRRPCFLLDRESGKATPLGGWEDAVFYTHVAGPRLQFVAGEFVSCDDPDLQIDIRRITSDGLEALVHNPMQRRVAACLKTNFLEGGHPTSIGVDLDAGEEKRIVFQSCLRPHG